MYKNKPLAVIGIMKYQPDMIEFKLKLLFDDRNFPNLITIDLEEKFYFRYYAQEDYTSIFNKMKFECLGNTMFEHL